MFVDRKFSIGLGAKGGEEQQWTVPHTPKEVQGHVRWDRHHLPDAQFERLGMGGMYQGCGELALAERFHDVELIDVAHAGIFCHQLNPACSLSLFFDVKIMNMLIAQGLQVDTFSFSGEAVIGGFSMLKSFSFVNVQWNGADV